MDADNRREWSHVYVLNLAYQTVHVAPVDVVIDQQNAWRDPEGKTFEDEFPSVFIF